MKKSLLLIAAILVAALLAFADASGTWTIQGAPAGAPQKLVLSLTGGTLTGSMDGIAIRMAGTKNNDVWFMVDRGGKTYQYKGSYNGNSLVLTESTSSANNTYTFTRSGS